MFTFSLHFHFSICELYRDDLLNRVCFFPASCHKQSIQCDSVSNFFRIFLSNSGIYCFFRRKMVSICPQKIIYLKQHLASNSIKLKIMKTDHCKQQTKAPKPEQTSEIHFHIHFQEITSQQQEFLVLQSTLKFFIKIGHQYPCACT